MANDWRTAGLDESERALCRYAEKLTRGVEEMAEDDIVELRSHGLSDEVIHDTTQVVAYFNYINRIAEGLGVEPETFIRPWGNAE
jgi:uncharacterized peroxidase-related enzyme